MLRELGLRFYQVLLDHVKHCTVNTLGGMLLTRDLSEYEDCIRMFNDLHVTEIFVTMRELTQVTIVRPENLRTITEEGRLVSVRSCL